MVDDDLVPARHPVDGSVRIEVAAEVMSVAKRVRRFLVRASRTTVTKTQSFEVDLSSSDVVVERVPVGRVVDAVPPVREEDGVTIVPVVREEFVVVRRLVLAEEVRIRSVRSIRSHAGTVELREQLVEVVRHPLDD